MKKILFASVVAAMAFAVNANAQINFTLNDASQFSVGAGYVNETVIGKESSILDGNNKGRSWVKDRMILNGFYVEVLYNLDLTDINPGELVLETGLRYNCLINLAENSRTDITFTDAAGTGTIKGFSRSTTSDHLIDVPVHLKYAYDFVPAKVRAYAFAGPVLSFGLDAQTRVSAKTVNEYQNQGFFSRKIEQYNGYTGHYYIKTYNAETKKYDIQKGEDDKYRRYNMFDLKIALGLGVTILEKVDVKFGYNIGLLNKSFVKNVDQTKYSIHTNLLYFGATYNF